MVGGGGGLHLKLPRHCQNDSALRWVRGLRHFDVALIVRGEIMRPCPCTTNFDEKGELKWKEGRKLGF